MVHLGYDVARCAYVLCSLPHFKISFSAHVTFNEADFPFRDQTRVDPAPFSLVEEHAGKEIRHVACGEAWGSYPSLEREKPSISAGLRLADVHGTLGFGSRPARVCSQGPSDGTTLPGPLGRGGLVSLQASSCGEAPGKRPRVGTSLPGPFAWDGALSSAAPVGVRAAVAGSEASSSFSGSLPGSGLARGPPVVSGGARAAQCDEADAGVRRSQRSWKPSQNCLEGIAHASRDVTLAEEEMDQTTASDDVVQQSCIPNCVRLTQRIVHRWPGIVFCTRSQRGRY